jgi:pteridine reductase
MKTALVTGSGRRLGKEIAQSLADAGWDVIWHYNTTKPPAGVKSVQANLQNIAELPKLFQHGKVDLLINSASIFEQNRFAESTPQQFDDNFNLHVKAPYFLAQSFAKQGGSHIINIVDAFTIRNKASYFPYLLSKKALLNLTRMLAVELGPNIRVNAILPGAMRNFSDNLNDEFKQRRKEQLPQGDFATSEDVIKAIKFLNETNLTGQEIYVDAGEHLI